MVFRFTDLINLLLLLLLLLLLFCCFLLFPISNTSKTRRKKQTFRFPLDLLLFGGFVTFLKDKK